MPGGSIISNYLKSAFLSKGLGQGFVPRGGTENQPYCSNKTSHGAIAVGRARMLPNSVTTALELPGYRVVRNIGIVRGITVRSRSVVGNIAGAFQIFFGGSISVYTNLCERTRTEAYEMMCEHADAVGANAILMMRYDANEILSGVTEVICYGTAVVVEEEQT
jgi:uncharacterized protein YbjQ (UPF0145 family)